MADLNKLLTDISRSIVDDPDGVTVTETTDDNDTVCFELKSIDILYALYMREQ